MSRWVAVIAAALTLAYGADAGAQPQTQKATADQKAAPAKKAAPAPQPPLHIYLAKGEPNACGEGCSEWIAVEGRFDIDAAGRVNAFFKRHGGRKLPVYFHSPGGVGPAAYAIGRQLRKLGITTGAGKTIPQGCASADDRSNGCNAAKRSAQAVVAEWRPDATCSSACIWALIGGRVRHVPPSAQLGVHAAKLTLRHKYPDTHVEMLAAKRLAASYKSRMAEVDAQARRYIREMGIDDALLDAALKVPHDTIRYLSRNEIAGYGIDRREFLETRWLPVQQSIMRVHVHKWIVVAKGADRKDYRASLLALACSQSQWEHARMTYSRGLSEAGRSVSAMISIGGHKAVFSLSGRLTQVGNLFDAGSSASVDNVPFDQIEAAAAAGAIKVVEIDPLAVEAQPQAYQLSTHGLIEGLRMLRSQCAPSAPRAPQVGGPNGPSMPSIPSIPSIPADAKPRASTESGGGEAAELK